MKKSYKSANPFYLLLVPVGITFVVTAMTFYVMTARVTSGGGSQALDHPLMQWMDEHGMTLLIAELVLLMIATFGAIGTDTYWQRRAAAKRDSHEPRPNGSPAP
jgi:hypothetical protein